jgi:hypothetical protein
VLYDLDGLWMDARRVSLGEDPSDTRRPVRQSSPRLD